MSSTAFRVFAFSAILSSVLLSNAAKAFEVSNEEVQLSPREEIAKLKRQLSNLIEMNFPAKVESLQQDMQNLRGVIEKQSHEIKALQEQQKNFYQDLNERLNQIKKNAPEKIEHSSTQKLENEPKANPYQQAIEAIKNKQYLEAQKLLTQFLQHNPKDKLAGNAHFWLGEAYFHQNKKSLAKKEFETIKHQYPTNAKIPLALLKIGYIEIDQENYGKAKEIFRDLIKNFPGTPSAQLAKIKLEKLRKP